MSSEKNVKFSIITSDKGRLTKTYALSRDGALESQTAAHLVSGMCRVVEVQTAEELAACLDSLTPEQVVLWGVPIGVEAGTEVQVFSLKEFERRGCPKGSITRTKDSFAWPKGAGVMMLDYDPEEDGEVKDREALLAAIGEVLPIDSVCHIWRPSSSSFIHNGDVCLQGLHGQRVYIFVQDAQDIERAGKVLKQRLELKGYGRIEVSAIGAFLERGLVDSSVWQPNRLDFAAGAYCEAPLEQKRPDTVVFEGEYLDTKAALPDLTEDEERTRQGIIAEAKAEKRTEADEKRNLYADRRAREFLSRQGVTEPDDAQLEQAVRNVKRAIENNTLTGEFLIQLDNGDCVSVGEILDHPGKYHGQLCKDPLEPEYDGGRTVAKIYLFGGRPTITSRARHGRNFRLIRQPREVQITEGGIVEAVNDTIAVLRTVPVLFDRGSELVKVEGGECITLTKAHLRYEIGSNIQFFRMVGTKEGVAKKLLNPDLQLCNMVEEKGKSRNLKPLTAVITAPTMLPDGTILSRPGYDASSGLFLDMADEMPPIPSYVSEQETEDALNRIMNIFREFPFESPVARGVCLSAVLSATIRAAMPTAPGLVFDAPKQASGKTFLAKCIGTLATGEVPATYPHVSNEGDAEVRKRITTFLLTGKNVLLWDNVTGLFESESLAAFFTSEKYSDRILGASRTIEIIPRVLLLITGNNYYPGEDVVRRALVCRLNTNMENPRERVFTFNPLEFIKQNRQAIIRDALIYIRGALQHLKQHRTPLANYEIWDPLARQSVLWAVERFPDLYGDPVDSIRTMEVQDMKAMEEGETLQYLSEIFGLNKWFTAKEVYEKMHETWVADLKARRELLELFTSKSPSGKLTPRSVGMKLTFMKGKVANGLQLLMESDKRNGNRFIVVALEEEQPKAA